MRKPRKYRMQHDFRRKQTKARARRVYQVYKRTLSLAETGRVLGYTREWVRQLLAWGQRTGAIQFAPAATQRFNAALEKINKYDLIRAVEESGHRREILSKYKISTTILNRLLTYHGLSCREIKRSLAATRCVREYLQVLNTLEHHPNTYELQKEWGNLYGRICCRWGTLSKFKKTCGYPVPAPKLKGKPARPGAFRACEAESAPPSAEKDKNPPSCRRARLFQPDQSI